MGKYSAVLKQQGKRGFGVPSKAPAVGSFPLYPLSRARFALTIISSGAWDSKKTLRAQIAKRALAAHPSLRSYWSQLNRETITSTRRRAANPRKNTMARRRNTTDYAKGARRGEDDFDLSMEPGFETKTRAELKRAGKSSDYIRGYLEQVKEEEDAFYVEAPLIQEHAFNPRRNKMARRKIANPMRLLENPYGLDLGKGKAIRVGKGDRTHVKKGQYALCGAGEKSGDVRPSAAKIITCYRCIKLININAGHDVDRNLRYGKRTKHLMIPGGREGAWVAGRDDHRYPMPDFASMVGSEKHPTQDRDIAKRLKTKRRSAKAARAGKRARKMVSNPKRGTLEDRYNNYVDAMISMGRAYVDFDAWLNGNV